MKTIVIIDHEPLTPRRMAIFHIEELAAKGFDVRFWDCSQIFHKGMRLADSITDFDRLHVMNSLEDVSRAIDGLEAAETVFIVEVFNRWENRAFFRLLSDKGCYTVRMELYASSVLPDIPFFQKIRMASFRKIATGLSNRLKKGMYWVYKKYWHIKGDDLFVSSGDDFWIDVKINHPDWEKYKSSLGGQRLCKGNYAVFLDEYFPNHPDMRFFVKDCWADTTQYRRSMLRFFDEYQQRTGLEVVIAAHPKAEYQGDEWGARKIIKYKTVELVRDAREILMHSSAALSFVMMFDKPLALITTDGYDRLFPLKVNVRRISRLTGLPVYNIDREDLGNVKARAVSEITRTEYISRFLTSPGIEGLKTVDIIAEVFHALPAFSCPGRK